MCNPVPFHVAFAIVATESAFTLSEASFSTASGVASAMNAVEVKFSAECS